MKSYVEELGLRFDPFEPSASKKDFYGGGNRQDLCNQIVESAMYGENIIAVYGCLGSGKSMLATEIARSFADEAVSALVLATVFMNSEQFAEELAEQLELPTTDFGKEMIIEDVSELAQRLDLEAKSLLIQIDDAHELSREVLRDLLKIKSSCPPNSVHIVLFGETELANMLESIFSLDQGAGLIEFELSSFASDATIDYVRFKLERAGYSKTLPMSGAALGSIHNSSNGVPGTINVLASEMLEKECRAQIADAGLTDFDVDAGHGNRRSVGETEPETSRSPAFVYMVAASVLVVVFLAAIIFIRPDANSVNPETSIPVAAASVPAATATPEPDQVREVQSTPAPQTVSAVNSPSASIVSQTTPTSGQVNRQSSSPAAEKPTEPESKPLALLASAEPAVLPKTMPEPKIEEPTPSPVTTPVPTEPQAVKALPAGLNKFEQQILRSPSSNFVVQILGASSEVNIQKFIEKEKIDLETGYFETRLNGKPWFVVLVGNFPDRASATAAMDALPATAKAYGPWVRSVADIQTAIQALGSGN